MIKNSNQTAKTNRTSEDLFLSRAQYDRLLERNRSLLQALTTHSRTWHWGGVTYQEVSDSLFQDIQKALA
jgi:hypothetical protein